jgi:hypothetical protein
MLTNSSAAIASNLAFGSPALFAIAWTVRSTPAISGPAGSGSSDPADVSRCFRDILHLIGNLVFKS